MFAEHEILDRLRTELRSAANDCELMAKLPARGPAYARYRHSLRIVEGHIRLLGTLYREDASWLPIAFNLAQALKWTGQTLREHPRTANSNLGHPVFMHLAEMLRAIAVQCDRKATAKTGRRGMILPKVRSEVRTAGRPMQVKLPSGLIVPSECVNPYSR